MVARTNYSVLDCVVPTTDTEITRNSGSDGWAGIAWLTLNLAAVGEKPTRAALAIGVYCDGMEYLPPTMIGCFNFKAGIVLFAISPHDISTTIMNPGKCEAYSVTCIT